MRKKFSKHWSVYFSWNSKEMKNNKCAVIILFLILCFTTNLYSLTGDGNDDNVVTIADALLTAQYYVGLNPSTITTLSNLDVNANGEVDIMDALLIAQYYVDLISIFPKDVIIAISGAEEMAPALTAHYNLAIQADDPLLIEQIQSKTDALLAIKADAEAILTRLTDLVASDNAQSTANQEKTENPGPLPVGNLVIYDDDVMIPYVNSLILIARKYDSFNRTSHSFGKGWTFNYDTRVIMGVKENPGELIQPLQALLPGLAAIEENFSTLLDDYADIEADTLEAAEIAGTLISTATKAVNLAEQVVEKATLLGDTTLLSQARELLNSYNEKHTYATSNNTKWKDLSSGLTGSKSGCENPVTSASNEIPGALTRAENEAVLAECNKKKNTYTINEEDPDYMQYTGNNTISLVDQDGNVFVYTINTEPDYSSGITYANGQPNFYPEGAETTPLQKTADTLSLLADGGYQIIKKDRTLFTYDYYGQLQSITDTNGNRLTFGYTDHVLSSITDDFSRVVSILQTDGRIEQITDPAGRIFTYGYNPEGRLETYIDSMNHTTQFAYTDGLLTRITYADQTSKSYDYITVAGAGVLNTITDEELNTEIFRYFPGENYYEHENAEGIVEKIYYNEKGLTERILNNDDSFVSFKYDENYYLKEKTDVMNTTHQYEFDTKGNLLTHTIPGVLSESWTYNKWGKVLTHSESVSVNSYDDNGNLNRTTYPDATYEEYTYNARGQVETVQDRNGNLVHYTYDINGYLESVTDQDNLRNTYDNDVLGNVRTHTDPGGNIYQYDYYNDGTLKQEIDQYNYTTTYTYTKRGQLKTITDRFDTITEYEYYNNCLLKKEVLNKTTDSPGTITEYYYRKDGLLSSKIIDTTYRIDYFYDTRGFREKIIDPVSNIETYFENYPSGKIKIKTDSKGNTFKYDYTQTGKIERKYINDKLISSYTYTPDNKIETVTNEQGNTTSYFYNDQKRLETIVHPQNITEEYKYYSNGEIKEYIDKNNNLWKYTYTKTGQPEKIIDKDGNYTMRTYDTKGRLEQIRDFKGNITTYNYDTHDRVTDVLLPSGETISYSYNPQNTAITVTDERKNSTVYHYDTLGRLEKIVDPYQNQILYTYNNKNQTKEIRNTKGDTFSIEYDNYNRVKKETDPDGVWQEYRYDSLGNVLYIGDASGKGVSHTYDAKGRPLTITNQMNETISYTYDDDANSKTETIGEGKSHTYYYNEAGRLVREVNKLGYEQSFRYDGNGNITYKNAFDGTETTYVYDHFDNCTEIHYADGTMKTYEYDKNSNLTLAQNADSFLVFTYDKMNRLTGVHDQVRNKQITYGYDEAGNRNLISWYGGQRTQYFEYGDNNELKKVTDHEGNPITFEYDDLGRELRQIRPGDCTTEKGYTKAGRLTFVKNTSLQPGENPISKAYVYNNLGNINYEIDESGGIKKFEYDDTGRLKNAWYPHPDGTPTISERKNEIDMQERLHLGLDSVNRNTTYGLPLVDGPTPLTWDQTNLTRIEDAFADIGLPDALLQKDRNMWQETFYYDDQGNRSYKVNYQGVIKYEYNDAGALIQAGNRSYDYDMRGNLIHEAVGTKEAVYNYNHENRVVRIETTTPGFLNWSKETHALGIEYTYDALGRRNSRYYYTQQGIIGNPLKEYFYEEALHFLYDGKSSHVLADLFDTDMQSMGITDIKSHTLTPRFEYINGNGDIINKTVFSGFRQGITDLNTKEYFHHDVRGSLIMVTHEEGIVKELCDYDAFGNPTKDDFNFWNEYGYIGKRYDIATGHYDLGFRNYNPVMAGFTTIDPVRDGAQWYQYCKADPVNFIDSTGLFINPNVIGNTINDTIEGYKKANYIKDDFFNKIKNGRPMDQWEKNFVKEILGNGVPERKLKMFYNANVCELAIIYSLAHATGGAFQRNIFIPKIYTTNPTTGYIMYKKTFIHEFVHYLQFENEGWSAMYELYPKEQWNLPGTKMPDNVDPYQYDINTITDYFDIKYFEAKARFIEKFTEYYLNYQYEKAKKYKNQVMINENLFKAYQHAQILADSGFQSKAIDTILNDYEKKYGSSTPPYIKYIDKAKGEADKGYYEGLTEFYNTRYMTEEQRKAYEAKKKAALEVEEIKKKADWYEYLYGTVYK